jgi:hypothetical protein
MSRLLSSIAVFTFVAMLGSVAGAKPCHDAKGKFVTCPKATSAPMIKKDAKGKCHGAGGKFVMCPK